MMKHHPNEVQSYDTDSLALNQRIRVKHEECSGHKYDKTLSITRVNEGLLYYCYRCGVRGIRFIGMNPANAKRYLQKHIKNSIANDVVELPDDFWPLCQKPNSIPNKAYAWLYKYELDDSDLCEYNIGFSNKSQLVVIPIYNFISSELIGYVGRNINHKYNKLPKYLNRYKQHYRVYYFIERALVAPRKLVIVEDIISAIKVHKATGFACIALLNTSVGENTITGIMKDYQNYLWLDDDARIKGLTQIMRLKQHGYLINQIHSSCDPKELSIHEITKKLP